MEFRLRKQLIAVPLKGLIAVLLFLLLVFVFSLMAHEVVGENESGFDNRVFAFFKSYSSPALIRIFHYITFFGSSNFLLPAYTIIVIILLLQKRRADAINTAILGIVSTLMMYGLKGAFARKRPELPLFRELHNFSFPSGHALSSFVFCSLLIGLVWKSKMARPWKITLVVLIGALAVMIGISRIVLRYHYATDVLAGFCLGFAWVILYYLIYQRFTGKEKNGSKT